MIHQIPGTDAKVYWCDFCNSPIPEGFKIRGHEENGKAFHFHELPKTCLEDWKKRHGIK